jgi:hypothetical protein
MESLLNQDRKFTTVWEVSAKNLTFRSPGHFLWLSSASELMEMYKITPIPVAARSEV